MTRRSFLGGVTASGLLLAGPAFWQQPARAGAARLPTEMTVFWVTPASVSGPRVVLGTAADGFGRVIGAQTHPARCAPRRVRLRGMS